MKKLLSLLTFCIVTIISTVSPVLAENYHYKLYNPKTKEVSSSIMITISATDSTYVIGFLANGASGPCLVSSTDNKGNGLLGGSCIIMEDNGTYSWKEYQPNSFNSELQSIILERSAQGKHLPDEAIKYYTVSK